MENLAKPLKQYSYQGPLVVPVIWLIFSLVGHLMAVIGGDSNGVWALVYLVTAIISAMVLNNRYHGINHRLQFFKSYMVVPQFFKVWSGTEEAIAFSDIKEIVVFDKENPSELIIRTELMNVPLNDRKMPSKDLIEVLHLVHHFSGCQITVRGEALAKGQTGQLHKDFPNWKKNLILWSLSVGLWAIFAIAMSGPYVNLLFGGKIFALSLLTAVVSLTLLLVYLRNVKRTDPEQYNSTKHLWWQKLFFISYLGLYSGVAMAFTMVWLNGKLDSGAGEAIVFNVEGDSPRSEGLCVMLTVNPTYLAQRQVESRAPASLLGNDLSQLSTDHVLTFCRKDLPVLKENDQLVLTTHRGLFGEPWVSHLKKSENELK